MYTQADPSLTRAATSFCRWLLSADGLDDRFEAIRWAGFVRRADDDGFRALRSAVQREAALLARRGTSLVVAISQLNRRIQHLVPEGVEGHLAADDARMLLRLQEEVTQAVAEGYQASDPDRGHTETEARLLTKVAELAALQKINGVVNSSLDLSQVLSHTVQVVAEVMHADVCAIFLYEDPPGRLVLRATKGLNPDAVGRASLAIGEGITGWAAQYGQPVALADSWRDPRFAYVPALMEEPYHGMLAVPIILFTQKKLIGVLDIETYVEKEFTAEEIAFAETVAGQIAIGIENARLYGLTDGQLREKVTQLATLQRVTASIVSNLDLGQVLSTIARHAAAITGTNMSAIFELDEQTQELTIVASHGLSPQYLEVRVPVGEGAVGQAVATGKPIVVSDALSDPRLKGFTRWVVEEGYRSMFSVPLVSKNRVLGGISVYTYDRREFANDQIDLLITFADDAAMAIENARLYEEMREALRAKSVLLQELHHRVKNNLQTVASLLRLQMRRISLPQAREPLGLTQARIESMAAVHDLLSQEDIGLTTVHGIARRIGDIACADLVPEDKTVRIEMVGSDVAVASQQATLLALVVSELICNALTHGFADCGEGTVVVGAERRNGQVRVEVHDDGRGLPGGFSLEQDSGLGLSIIQRVVIEQLKGTFEIGRGTGGGTSAVVTFASAQ